MNGQFLTKKNRDVLQRMSFMKRFNNAVHIHEENVAEHSFYVAMYAYALCDELRIGGVLRQIIIEKALVHDVHESIVSDIPHNVKKMDADVEHFFESYERHYNRKNFTQLEKTYNGLFAVDQGICDLVVTLADVLSVRQYAELEVSLGNKHFEEILEGTNNRISECIKQLKIAKLTYIDEVERLINS